MKLGQPILGVTDESATWHGRAETINRYVGNRIRCRRMVMGMSQQQLARLIGVNEQKSRRYERGSDRITAARLHQIADVLAVPLSWFFTGLSPDTEPSEMTPRQRIRLDLARNFSVVDVERNQDALRQMARLLVGQHGRH